jgi:hypothetical protein
MCWDEVVDVLVEIVSIPAPRTVTTSYCTNCTGPRLAGTKPCSELSSSHGLGSFTRHAVKMSRLEPLISRIYT